MLGNVVKGTFGLAGPPEGEPGPGIDMTPQVAADLAFERAIFRRRPLSIFRRNATTWEVLLMLAAAGGEGPGLYELVEAVEIRALGSSALLRFLRERRDEGSILFTRNHQKQSKWSLSLREDLRLALAELLAQKCGR